MSAPLSQTNNPIILEKLFARIQQEGGVMLQSKMEGFSVPILTHSFWTSRQRQASSLQEVSYRACFKPQLPAFFIEALSEIGQSVYDPFSGRGTTPIEAALRRRHIVANDINPLSPILYRPRLFPPVLEELEIRLNHIKWDKSLKAELDLSMFYHEKTLRELLSLRCYLQEKKALNQEDHVDQWIRMVASNRLSGHSPGFFSVYSLPPNQAVLPERQRKINRERNQTPTYRPVAELILKKSRQLLRDVNEQVRRILAQASDDALILCGNATATPQIADNSIQLTVTSPPFLNIVDYGSDNWLRLWFNQLDKETIVSQLTVPHSLEAWATTMKQVFSELFRVTWQGGFVVFEVGELQHGSIRLEETVLPIANQSGFIPRAVFLNKQQFTKTANIWGIKNNRHGTLTNRIVILEKP